ncbi:glycosyltransferase family 4 protein [Clostridium sp. YIM B02506]|uniref:glycosyltransferase family 4 protein n=1 Tax=Clostridium sp. YIM B02506 TaxID=2910680 RepID=UPI001EEE0B90|nr:glycosyltransferase family 4 protein [Clostridium sp. YIM B02506]
MKKILYLHAGAELYGADIVLLELLKNLDKDKFTPYVILPSEGPLVEKLRGHNIWVKVMEYPIIRRKIFNILGLLKYIKDYFIYSSKIKAIVKHEKINIIHTNTAAVLEGIFIKRMLKIPLIWHIHEIIVKPKIVHKVLSYLIATNSSEVVTVSEAVKEHLKSTGYFKKNINVIYNGVDNNVFNKENNTSYINKEFNIPTEAIVVGMIGRVNAWKGQNDFLGAMDIVLEKHKDVYAMLVGGVFEGEEWRIEELKSKIKSMKNKNRVVFDQYRNDSKNIHALYDIFVLPSTNPDPLPTVVLEAMASSTPIVGYRHGGICEMVKENYNGLLAEVGNVKDLAEKISLILNDKNLRKKFQENSCLRQKENFSLRSYVDKFTNLYDKYEL